MSNSSGSRADAARLLGEAVEISDGIYACAKADGTWWINNTGFVVGSRGVMSVDACATSRRTEAYLAAIAAVTVAPVRTLINTHHHDDHTVGNYLRAALADMVEFNGCRPLACLA